MISEKNTINDLLALVGTDKNGNINNTTMHGGGGVHGHHGSHHVNGISLTPNGKHNRGSPVKENVNNLSNHVLGAGGLHHNINAATLAHINAGTAPCKLIRLH